MSPIIMPDEEEGELKMYYDEVEVRQQLRRQSRASFWSGVIVAVTCTAGLAIFVGWYISG